jgi:hypothetical protein
MFGGAVWATGIIIGLAMVKARLVMTACMEGATAPVALRMLCDLWIMLVGAMILMALPPLA